jgi:hypothetical protein
MPTSPRDCPSPFLDPSFYKKHKETAQEFLKMKNQEKTTKKHDKEEKA